MRTDARTAAENILVVAQDLADRGARTLVLHWALASAVLPTGLPVLELAEPVVDPHSLAAMGFELVMAGHIHKRQVILEQPFTAHIGCLTRGDYGEAANDAGAWHLTDYLTDEGLKASWFEVADRPLRSFHLDARGQNDPTEALLAMLADGELAGDPVVRVEYQVTRDQVVDQERLRAHLEFMGAWRIDQITPVIERMASVRSAGVTEATDPKESWDRWSAGQEIPEAIAETVRQRAHEMIASAT